MEFGVYMRVPCGTLRPKGIPKGVQQGALRGQGKAVHWEMCTLRGAE